MSFDKYEADEERRKATSRIERRTHFRLLLVLSSKKSSVTLRGILLVSSYIIQVMVMTMQTVRQIPLPILL